MVCSPVPDVFGSCAVVAGVVHGRYGRRRSVALATFAMITANGGITSATTDMAIAAVVEYRSTTAQDRTNNPMQTDMSTRYRRLSRRDGCGPASSGSWSLPATSGVLLSGTRMPGRAVGAIGGDAVQARLARCSSQPGGGPMVDASGPSVLT